MVGVRFEETIEERLSGVSRRMRRTKSNLIREAVLEKLDDWEDLADAIEALENPARTWTLEGLEQGADLKADAPGRLSSPTGPDANCAQTATGRSVAIAPVSARAGGVFRRSAGTRLATDRRLFWLLAFSHGGISTRVPVKPRRTDCPCYLSRPSKAGLPAVIRNPRAESRFPVYYPQAEWRRGAHYIVKEMIYDLCLCIRTFCPRLSTADHSISFKLSMSRPGCVGSRS